MMYFFTFANGYMIYCGITMGNKQYAYVQTYALIMF